MGRSAFRAFPPARTWCGTVWPVSTASVASDACAGARLGADHRLSDLTDERERSIMAALDLLHRRNLVPTRRTTLVAHA